MDVLVPYAAVEPKTRLAGVLCDEERTAFAAAMLADVCAAVAASDASPTVVSTAPIETAVAAATVVVDDRPLTDAVNARLEPPTAVVMADLALVTPTAIDRLFATDGDVVIAPGLGGGTNALVVRHPEFHVDYHGASVRDHRRIADAIGAAVATIDSFRLAVDVDEPADLAEVLLHGRGRARTWLEDAGFAIETTDGRVKAVRQD